MSDVTIIGPYLQSLCSLEELRELVLGHVHLPGVHEGEQEAKILLPDVPEDDDRMLTGVALQKENVEMMFFSDANIYFSLFSFLTRCEVANI